MPAPNTQAEHRDGHSLDGKAPMPVCAERQEDSHPQYKEKDHRMVVYSAEGEIWTPNQGLMCLPTPYLHI